MANTSLIARAIRLLKRHAGFTRQIIRDLPWHFRITHPAMKPRVTRIVEQSRLLVSSAICAEDYYHLGLYTGALSLSSKKTFLGSYEKWRYYNTINPPIYDVVARDKAIFHLFANATDIPTPETLATTSPQGKPHVGRTLLSREAIRKFLLDDGSNDLFFKPADGSLGEGAISIGQFDADTSSWELLPSGSRIEIEDLLERLSVNGHLGRFLIQRRLIPHPRFANIVPNVCPTLRLMTLYTEHGIEYLGAALRLGSGRGPTDNIAGGGLIVPVNLKDGSLEQAICLANDVPETVDSHPFTGAKIEQKTLPYWDQIFPLIERCASHLNFIPCIGWDIGLTVGGPVVIEINTRPRCISVQSAQPHGLLHGALGRELGKRNGLLDCGLNIQRTR